MSVPDDPVEIIVMPEFQRGVARAHCDSPGPLDVGQKTFYAVAPLPAEGTPPVRFTRALLLDLPIPN